MRPPLELAQAISEAAEEFRVPETLLLAWSWSATEWTATAYKYEPNLDRFGVSGRSATWASHPEWQVDGPTCEEFFTFHPDRAPERLNGIDYGFVAQTHIAAGYGPFLLRYPVALLRGSPMNRMRCSARTAPIGPLVCCELGYRTGRTSAGGAMKRLRSASCAWVGACRPAQG